MGTQYLKISRRLVHGFRLQYDTTSSLVFAEVQLINPGSRRRAYRLALSPDGTDASWMGRAIQSLLSRMRIFFEILHKARHEMGLRSTGSYLAAGLSILLVLFSVDDGQK
jgi:hypothetical protein